MWRRKFQQELEEITIRSSYGQTLGNSLNYQYLKSFLYSKILNPLSILEIQVFYQQYFSMKTTSNTYLFSKKIAMKILIICTLSIALISGFTLQDAKFKEFKLKYGKNYYTKTEESKRLAIFKENLKSIEAHNALYQQGSVSWKKGITKFSDLTDIEYKALLGLQLSSEIKEIPKLYNKVEIPDSIDWRQKNAVTAVRNNENYCRSTWAIALAESVESAYYLKTGNLINLSVQQLIDCTSDYADNGCGTGYLRETMPYIYYKGLESEASYPPLGSDTEGECKYNGSAIVTKISDYIYFYSNQYQLEQSVGNYGPVASSLDASELKDYKGGIYASTTCSSLSPNLGATIVGYGSENGTDYWLVKASFGTNWGEDGYFRILKKANDFACGLYRQPTFPVI